MKKKKSARRSSTRKRPSKDPLTFFVDIDLGIHFYEHLSGDARFNVEFHDDHFREGAPDDSEWLTLIADRGWVGITHDRKIRRDHRPLIERSEARVIIVVGRRPLQEQAGNFIATYSRIERFVRKHDGPYTAKLHYPTAKELKKLKPQGRIDLWGEW